MNDERFQKRQTTVRTVVDGAEPALAFQTGISKLAPDINGVIDHVPDAS